MKSSYFVTSPNAAMIFTEDYGAPEGKDLSKRLLRKDGIIDCFLGKRIHCIGLGVEVRQVKGRRKVVETEKRSTPASSMLISLSHTEWKKKEMGLERQAKASLAHRGLSEPDELVTFFFWGVGKPLKCCGQADVTQRSVTKTILTVVHTRRLGRGLETDPSSGIRVATHWGEVTSKLSAETRGGNGFS